MIQLEEDTGTLACIACGEHEIDALHYHADVEEANRSGRPVILRLHGVLGNLLDETEHFLPAELARRGYASLNMNTLLANLGLFYGFGIFDDVIPQIDTVRAHLRELGFERMVVAGHGLGGCMAIRYAAARNLTEALLPQLCGVVAIATPFSLPDTIRRRWARFGSEPTYEEVAREAGRRFGNGDEGHDETILIRKAHGPTRRPEHSEVYTLKTWWHLAGPEAAGAKSYLHVGKIRVPILIVDALRDEVVGRTNHESLARAVAAAGHDAVTHVELEANHAFDGRHAELARAIARWLDGPAAAWGRSAVHADRGGA